MNHSTVLPLAALSVALGLLLASGHAGAQAVSSPPAPLSQAELTPGAAGAADPAVGGAPACRGGRAQHRRCGTATQGPALDTRVAALESSQAKAPKVTWSKGAPEFSSADGSVAFRPRGRLFVDASSTDGSSVSDRNISGTEIRSVRLGAEGRYGILGWAVEGDFADNAVAWKSVYATVDHRLFGLPTDLTVGNRLNDRGIDGSSSTSNTPFQDRNVVGIADAAAARLFGVGLAERVYGKDWHASLSVAGNDLNNAGTDNDSQTWATRVHWNPVANDAVTVHLGPGPSTRRSPQAPAASSAVRPSPGTSTTWSRSRRAHCWAPSAARPMARNWQASSGRRGRPAMGYAQPARADASGRYDLDHQAWAISAGWFLAGARPAYSGKAGTWGRVKVADPVTRGGAGAWELKGRFEDVDYAELPSGGTGHAWTLGANWYLNDFSRVMFEAIRWQTRNRSGTGQGRDEGTTFNTRLQVAF